jgi:dipeptidyl-peptidase-4
MKPLFVAFALSLALAAPALAERLPTERAFADPNLAGPTARGLELSPDGKLVTYLLPKPEDHTTLDLWAISAAGGEPRRLIDARALEPKEKALSEAEKARRERQRISDKGVVEYRWDDQGKQILAPVGGDLYLANAASGAVRRLTETPGDETDSRFSPKGRFVSYVRDQNLYVMDLTNGAERAITKEGKDTLSFGVAEFVAQEEMGRFTGYWWSPDEQRIAFTRVDESGVDIVPRFDIGADGVSVVNQRYPRAGRPNAKVSLFVQDLASGARVPVDLGPDADVYLARADWSKDGRTLYVQRETRDQKRLDILAVDPATGRSHVILTETNPAWVDLTNDFRPLKSGDFLWTSDRTGWRHIYLYDREGKLIRAVTKGDWRVASVGGGGGRGQSAVVGVDEAKGLVYFMASLDTPIERHLYVTSFKQPGEPKKLTSGHGWWTPDMAETPTAFVADYSDPETPPQTALYDLSGKRIRWIEENRLAPGHPYYPYHDQRPTYDYGTMKAADGSDLHYVLVKPAGFDPAKRYPAIVEVYGGPGAQQVTRTWRPATEQLLTQAGYVLFQLDNRGSANRSKAFETALAGHLGEVEVTDQMAGLKHLQALPFIDPGRVGVMGWSYGGYMTIRLLTEPGSGFKAGAAGGPPADWRNYDTHYTERYMGQPQARAAAYDASSLIPRLKNLNGRLLLLHGMADDNVTFDNGTRIMAELQNQSKTFDLDDFPGQRHGVKGPARQLQLWKTYLEFFARNLGGEGP